MFAVESQDSSIDPAKADKEFGAIGRSSAFDGMRFVFDRADAFRCLDRRDALINFKGKSIH